MNSVADIGKRTVLPWAVLRRTRQKARYCARYRKVRQSLECGRHQSRFLDHEAGRYSSLADHSMLLNGQKSALANHSTDLAARRAQRRLASMMENGSLEAAFLVIGILGVLNRCVWLHAVIAVLHSSAEYTK